jgi:hypothetical protein
VAHPRAQITRSVPSIDVKEKAALSSRPHLAGAFER